MTVSATLLLMLFCDPRNVDVRMSVLTRLYSLLWVQVKDGGCVQSATVSAGRHAHRISATIRQLGIQLQLPVQASGIRSPACVNVACARQRTAFI